jgi:hypothetical protein
VPFEGGPSTFDKGSPIGPICDIWIVGATTVASAVSFGASFLTTTMGGVI